MENGFNFWYEIIGETYDLHLGVADKHLIRNSIVNSGYKANSPLGAHAIAENALKYFRTHSKKAERELQGARA